MAKFIISSAVLARLLSQVTPLVSKSPVVPILSNVLLTCKSGALTATASDLETTLTAGPVTIESRAADGDWSMAVPVDKILNTLGTLADQPVTIDLDLEIFAVEVKTSNGRFRVSGEDPAQFPRTPEVKPLLTRTISAVQLARVLTMGVPMASKDTLRPAMTGLLFEFEASKLTVATTDGHRCLRYIANDVAGDGAYTAILPAKALGILGKHLAKLSCDAVLSVGKTNITVTLPGICFTCRLIDEQFPEWRNVIPARNPHRLTVDSADLLSALSRVGGYANTTTHQVRLRPEAASLHITGEDLDFSAEGEESIDCLYKGDELEIGFNARFLLEMFSALGSQQAVMALSTPNRAAVITPADQREGEDVLMLVMPVQLNQYV